MKNKKATPAGLEPVTSAVTGRRSNQLSYGAVVSALRLATDRYITAKSLSCKFRRVIDEYSYELLKESICLNCGSSREEKQRPVAYEGKTSHMRPAVTVAVPCCRSRHYELLVESVGLFPGLDVDVVFRIGLPCIPSGLHDVFDVVLCVPAHLFVDALRGADQVRRIACATGHDGLFERQAGDLLDLIDDLTHGGAFAGADVEGVVLAFIAVQILQGGDVGVGQIGDVDVVAHAGAIRSRVVVAEDRRSLALLQAVEQHRDEVQDCRILKLDRAAAGHVEIAQAAEANAAWSGRTG